MRTEAVFESAETNNAVAMVMPFSKTDTLNIIQKHQNYYKQKESYAIVSIR